jgi:hypothetical protein
LTPSIDALGDGKGIVLSAMGLACIFEELLCPCISPSTVCNATEAEETFSDDVPVFRGAHEREGGEQPPLGKIELAELVCDLSEPTVGLRFQGGRLVGIDCFRRSAGPDLCGLWSALQQVKFATKQPTPDSPLVVWA